MQIPSPPLQRALSPWRLGLPGLALSLAFSLCAATASCSDDSEESGGGGDGGGGLLGNIDAGGDSDAGAKDDISEGDDTSANNGPAQACVPGPVVPVGTGFFEDISDRSGIRVDNYDPSPPRSIPINDHSRLGFVDLNGDNLDDIVMHSLFPNPQAGIPFEHLVFLNNGDGTFADASTASGLRDIQAGFFAYGDVDNDGDQDVFAGLDIPLGAEHHQVLLNDGQGVFSPLEGSGVEDTERISTTAANAVFFDMDSDGVLDLFIGHGQTSFRAPDSLLRGLGDGRFENVSQRLGGNRSVPSNGSVTCDYDNDGDQDIFVSTYSVSTELGANILWENDGQGNFEDVAVERGFASLPGGNPWLGSTNYGQDPEPDKGPGEYIGSNGFGIDCKDINNDGYLDIYLATISHPVTRDYNRKWSDATQVLINQGPDAGYTFVNIAADPDSGYPFNEGDIDGGIVDFDNDGRLDLSVTRDSKYESGYPDDKIEQKSWFGLMHQQPDGTFKGLGTVSGINNLEASNSASLLECASNVDCAGSPGEACLADRCRIPCQSRDDCPTDQEICHSGGFCRLLVTMKKGQNHAWSDIDLDGDMDLLVGGRDAGGGRPNFLFLNTLGQQNRWLSLRLVGDGQQVNRDAIGARVTVTTPESVFTREVQNARGTYNSTDTRRLIFGLGDTTCPRSVKVRWPDGTEIELLASETFEGTHLVLTYPSTLSQE